MNNMEDRLDLEKHIDAILITVKAELLRAYLKFPRPQSSGHETYGVLCEELNKEYFEHVCADTWKDVAARKELVQVAAMAVRGIVDTPWDN